MADGVDGLQIQRIITVGMAKPFRLDVVLILLPTVGEMVVQVLLRNTLIVTNEVATMGAVSIFVRKPTWDVPGHAF